MTIYAHTLPGQTDQTHWETIQEHEQQVAERCRAFLSRIDPRLGDCGDLLGMWHDIGKYSESFQAYLSHAGGADDVLWSESIIPPRVTRSCKRCR